MLQSIVLIAHLAVASLIIVFVLLQRGKGADAGTGFGAGASGTVFGSRGSSNFFSRTTAVLATLFFATNLALAYFATQRTEPESLLEGSVLDVGPGDERPAPGAGSALEPPVEERVREAPPELPDLELPEPDPAPNPELPRRPGEGASTQGGDSEPEGTN